MDPIRRTALYAVTGVVAMGGLGFASVPLYRLFCQATGLEGTTQRAARDSVGAVAGKTVMVRFDANHVPAIAWTFAPEKREQKVTFGARNIAFFTATNNAKVPVTGRALYNVQPNQAGSYFTKIECFCFTRQTLQPGQTVRMPVIYYVDPKMIDDPDANDIDAITLSYTFYPVDAPTARS